jgi:hypothetical protein
MVEWGNTEWEQRVREVSLRVQGDRPGFIGVDIAQAMDPRLGGAALAFERILFVPFNLSMALDDQWDNLRGVIDETAKYAYRFTAVKRPRKRSNVYRNVFIFLSVVVEGRDIRSVAAEVFRKYTPPSRQNKARGIVDKVAETVEKHGIELPVQAAQLKKTK